MSSFQLAATPHLYFGSGQFDALPKLARSFGSKALVVTGAKSFMHSSHGLRLLQDLKQSGIAFRHEIIANEPSPAIIDEIVKSYEGATPDVVIAIGGGSVVDAGKALSAMLTIGGSVKDYLEGVGTKTHEGVKIPFIAVPTTAGTGSEATKNAVLSETGHHGYKKSLRHNNFVPDIALIDPTLMVNCPPGVTAASGMDAFTQLLESYLSTQANAVTDALALEGLQRVAISLPNAYRDGTDLIAREDMALAAYLSGVTLANAGLGLVHGFASAIGGYFAIPHGVICSALMGPANKVTVRILEQQGLSGALGKYARAGKIFSGNSHQSDNYYIHFLLNLIEEWTVNMNIPRMGHYGIITDDHDKIVGASDNKNNPVKLQRYEMMEVLTLAM